jgi:serine/threonine-protein kinase
MPPDKINNCDIIGEIGSGGMANIFKAVQNSLNRPVAIKELKPEFLNDAQVCARFVREATALATLQHENIVHIYDFVKQDDSFRMVMEYVEGSDLFDLLEKIDKVPASVAMVIALAVASGLEYAHYRGIIHRDIKPSNIIISHKGEVKLMDFGIARDQNLGDLTRPGTSLGTPAYMSPEQIMGVRVDFRTDIFSFGIVLYQMLTGVKPFAEGGGKTIMHKILNGSFILPRKINPNLPRRIEKIVLRCMAKEPKDRYQSTGDLRREIEAFLAKKVKMNYSGRLVTYLFHMGQINKDEAQTFVAPKYLNDQEMIREDKNMPPPSSLKMIASVQGVLGAIILIWILVVHFFIVPDSSINGSAMTGPPGALKVVAWPWADIYIDDAYVETTPVARSFSLSPGTHEVRLHNSNYESVVKKVLIEPGKVNKMHEVLIRKK